MSKNVDEYLRIFSEALNTKDGSPEEMATLTLLEKMHDEMSDEDQIELATILRTRIADYTGAEVVAYQKVVN